MCPFFPDFKIFWEWYHCVRLLHFHEEISENGDISGQRLERNTQFCIAKSGAVVYARQMQPVTACVHWFMPSSAGSNPALPGPLETQNF